MMRGLRVWLWKTKFNLFPAYFGSGARITYLAPDWREVRVEVPLSWRTRNYVGTIFGGSMYAAVDPVYMMMLIKVLGPGYVVRDKAASIRFRKPGSGALHAVFRLTEDETDHIRSALMISRTIDRRYEVDLVDEAGTVRATVEKTISIRGSEPTATASGPAE